ncbi:hypothetical protein CYLTODRAFT_489187 [Cylindrobasidium torrendii FP15055 ss-10]|uniref:Pentacotripeptide-repeat region of PRORP domain-containing protein n=1 Tax=Cylindrobasidium torrendii FP15055 ss-10 TaxID=1314674 RepID=A0A0D7BF81_9AGAR|nr:hypothetical protein CYLTODRAFT_489187 [Cylindrobasidium torrendii FP15055 ss-10]
MSLRTVIRLGARPTRQLVAARLYSTRPTHAHDQYCRRKIVEFAGTFAQSKTRCSDIHEHYPGLAKTVRWSLQNDPKLAIQSPPQSYIDQVTLMFSTLAASALPADIAAMDTLLGDLPEIFLMVPTLDLHTHIIRVFLDNKRETIAIQWLQNMKKKPGGVSPTPELFHIVLESLRETSVPRRLTNVINSMVESGCSPTHETYKILLRAIWEHYDSTQECPPVEIFETMFADMSKLGLPADMQFATALHDEYARRTRPDEARNVMQKYIDSAPSTALTEAAAKDIAVADELGSVALKSGLDAALQRFENLEQPGTQRMLTAVLNNRKSSTLDDIHQASTVLGVTPSRAAYAMVIANGAAQSKGDGLEGAFAVYEAAKESGISPDAEMAKPLIRALAKQGRAAAFTKAMSLYDDLLFARSVAKNDGGTDGPDLATYELLFSALRPQVLEELDNPAAIIELLVTEMAAQTIPTNSIAGSLITALMHLSPTRADAMKAYEQHKHALTAQGYIYLLSQFVKMDFGKHDHCPDLIDYFQIANDMKAAGHEPDKPRVFNILISQYVEIVRRFPRGRLDSALSSKLAQSLRRLHDLVSLEAALEPDVAMYNQIMNVYAHLGCYGDAYRMWEQMALSGCYDVVSVSIAFDVCGFSGSHHAYKQILSRLAQERFTMDRNNYLSIIECQCRLRLLNDATKTICLDMPKAGFKPTVSTVNMLFYTARGNKKLLRAVVDRLQKYVPDTLKPVKGEWDPVLVEVLEEVRRDVD